MTIDYTPYLDKKVHKVKSHKPFKSGEKVNTVRSIISHPILNIPAFTFYEDDSYVECRKCHLFERWSNFNGN
jgi:retron-type reverse transcriptase